MSRPQCCNKTATPYRKDYGRGGWEEGFRCKRCGAIRIPFVSPVDTSYMDSLPAVRAAGMEWEKELSGFVPA
jgi:hypothetical protein